MRYIYIVHGIHTGILKVISKMSYLNKLLISFLITFSLEFNYIKCKKINSLKIFTGKKFC